MTTLKREFYIGIDLGAEKKKTTGFCILEREDERIFILENKDIFGKEIPHLLFHKRWGIKKYLKETKVIAIDAPLTIGKGKGKMRLYEKFLSTRDFRKEKVNPLPPALMPELCNFAKELVSRLEEKGFVLDINLIEVFPTFIEKISDKNLLYVLPSGGGTRLVFQTEHQKSALICAILAFLHSQFKTRYLGYKDGFIFLPEFSFWKKNWIKKIYQAWQEKDRLKYRRLITNIF